MVIFDLLQRDTRFYAPAIMAALAVAAAAVFLGMCLNRELRRPWWRTLPAPALVAVALALFAAHDYRDDSDHYQRLVTAYLTGRYVVAQGEIDGMDPPAPANRLTTFQVAGHWFAYQPGFDSVAFDGQNAGPYQLRDGERVKIYAVGPEIIHLEIAAP